jgi:hypothetical protein
VGRSRRCQNEGCITEKYDDAAEHDSQAERAGFRYAQRGEITITSARSM